MKAIRNLFKKNEELSDEEKGRINSIIENKNKPIESFNEDRVDLKDFVSHLNLEQINEIRDILDKREDELHELYGLKGEGAKPKKEYSGEINVEEPVHMEDLNSETYDEENNDYKEEITKIEDSVTQEVEEEKPNKEVLEKKSEEKIIDDDEYVELDENAKVNDLIAKDYREDFHNTQEDIYLKIAKLFGEENIFKDVRKNLNDNLPKDKNILCIGVRKADAFNKEDDSAQSSWFVQNIKKLDELSHFKVLSSSPTSKELFWDKDSQPVLISFKTTSELKSIDEFDF